MERDNRTLNKNQCSAANCRNDTAKHSTPDSHAGAAPHCIADDCKKAARHSAPGNHTGAALYNAKTCVYTQKRKEDVEDCCACDAKGAEKFSFKEYEYKLFKIIMPLLMIVAAMLIDTAYIKLSLFLAAYLISGGEFLIKAARNIRRGKVFDENFLMSLATLCAMFLGEMAEGVAVMLFYRTGEFFQELAVKKSRRSVSALMDVRPDYAVLFDEGKERTVAPDAVKKGDVIIIKPGERVPVDCTVLTGSSFLNTSAITGESLPRSVSAGDSVVSGVINIDGVITARADRAYGDSTVNKILDLVENAADKKAAAENFITKFARIYTPSVIAAALLTALVPPIFSGFAGFDKWGYRALIFLIISCPCALVISVPLSFFGGIGGASTRSILFKGANYMDALTRLKIVATDKTGTLTKGVFRVDGVFPAKGVSRDRLVTAAVYAEMHSSHPIAKSLKSYYGKELEGVSESYREITGKGVSAKLNGKTLLAGNHKLMEDYNIDHIGAERENGSVIYVAEDGIYLGHITVSDELRPEAKGFVSQLKKLGVQKTVMLTGDSAQPALRTAKDVGIDHTYYGLSPIDKVKKLEELLEKKPHGSVLAYIGDGINDAPVLARADIGIAMGGSGSDAAIESADIVLLGDNIDGVPLAVRIAQRTRGIVMQNIAFALGVKAAVMLLGVLGIASMWTAIFADVGVSLLAVLNATRALRTKHL